MLKVIRSNVLFTIILLFSVPAFASAPATDPVVIEPAAPHIATTDALPIPEPVVTPATSSNANGQAASTLSKNTLSQLLASARQHPTALKIGATTAICTLVWVVYKKVKSSLSKRRVARTAQTCKRCNEIIDESADYDSYDQDHEELAKSDDGYDLQDSSGIEDSDEFQL